MKLFDFELAHPTAAYLALAAPFVVGALYFYDRARRRQLTRRLGELPVIGRVIASASPGRRAVKAVIAGLGLACLLIAIARPQREGKRKVELRGLDLVVALDVSKSMLVADVDPTDASRAKHVPASRLARARELATALIDELPDDRIGPIVFAGAAAHFPLTEDHFVAAHFLAELGPADVPPGSNLAEVFRVGRCMLRPDLYDDLGCARLGRRGHGGDPLPDEVGATRGAPTPPAAGDDDDGALHEKVQRGKAMILFTDGGDPDEATLKEVATARELGIAVFVVGVGSAAGGVVHEIDRAGRATDVEKHTRDGEVVTSRRDDAGMRALAAAAGNPARYFIAAEHGELDPMPLVDALHQVDRGLATRQVKDLRDYYRPFLFAALMLLVLEAAIGTRRRQRYPEAR